MVLHIVASTSITAQLMQRQLSRHIPKMVDSIIEQYKSVAKLSEVKGAQILSVSPNDGNGGQNVFLQVAWTSRNLASMERFSTSSNYMVKGDKVEAFPPVPLNKNAVLSQRSPSGKRAAYIVPSEKDKEKESIVVVENNGSTSSFDLRATDKHGKVYADSEFACLEWSSDETKLAYIAEKKRPKATSFLATPKGEGEDTRGQEFQFIDDWGEQKDGLHLSVVCILDITTGEVSSHCLPDDLCPGQVVWSPNDPSSLFGVAFVSKPYRLGLVYCPIRESKLFHMDIEGNYSEISQGCHSIRSPRISPDGSRIAFLRNSVGGPHAKGSQLCVLAWPSKEVKVVIDVISRELVIQEGFRFKGIYSYGNLPRRIWLDDNKRLAFSTYKFDNIVPYVVNVDSGNITELNYLGSRTVLDVFNDWILMDFSLICQPNVLMVGQIPEEGKENSINMQEFTERRGIEGVPNYYRSHWSFINDTPHPDPKYSDVPISVIYYGPPTLEEGSPKRPLICWPHGGPHGVVPNAYTPSPAFFVKLGYSIVFANYRGSLGFGEDGVNALPGHVGNVDVSDVHKATLSCLERFKDVLDPNQVFLFGGSHGGFLVLHLAAQYPETYRAVSARNPVTDISGMANVTDIPDWTFVESGFSFQPGKVADSAILSKMYALSPMSHVDKMKTPTLFLIGKNDRRCPPSLGIHFYKMLLARGVETKLHLYDDCHPLSKVDVELDGLIHTALWFENHKQ